MCIRACMHTGMWGIKQGIHLSVREHSHLSKPYRKI